MRLTFLLLACESNEAQSIPYTAVDFLPISHPNIRCSNACRCSWGAITRPRTEELLYFGPEVLVSLGDLPCTSMNHLRTSKNCCLGICPQIWARAALHETLGRWRVCGWNSLSHCSLLLQTAQCGAISERSVTSLSESYHGFYGLCFRELRMKWLIAAHFYYPCSQNQAFPTY